MDYTLELIVVPVSDVDRAKAFYIDQAGFELLVDYQRRARTSASSSSSPPGSACAIAIGTGIGSMAPGSLHGLHLCVSDIEAARDELVGRGTEVGDIFHFGEAGQTPGVDPERRSYATFMPFQDPDGNTWLVQEVKRDWKVQVVKIDGRGRRVTDQVAAAFAGGESAFAALTERYRRELHVHCYRMLASFDEAEDAVQETFLRAWRARDTFDGSSLVRAWLYRIATNVCLDAIRRSGAPADLDARRSREVPWLTPYPDRLLDEIAPSEDEPEAVVVTRETIELAFLAALQVLPPRQRATLIARDVLGWPAMRDGRGARHVGRRGQQRPPAGARDDAGAPARRKRTEWSAGEPSEAERRAARELHRGARARRRRAGRLDRGAGPADHDAAGTDACSRGSTSSGRSSRTPCPRATGGCCRRSPTGCRRPRATCARRATPSTARSSSTSCAIVDGRIAEITTFGPELFPQFGLPEIYPG